jgi:hypothetical protein
MEFSTQFSTTMPPIRNYSATIPITYAKHIITQLQLLNNLLSATSVTHVIKTTCTTIIMLALGTNFCQQPNRKPLCFSFNLPMIDIASQYA